MSLRQQRIVVGVSGSRASIAALRWAAREARRRIAALRVVQVREPSPLRAPYAAASHDDPGSGAAAADQLAALVQDCLAGTPPRGTRADLVDGLPERVLVELSCDADLLVLGAETRPLCTPAPAPLARPLPPGPAVHDRPVGPVIRACLSGAHCPVVIISPAMADEAEPGRRQPPSHGDYAGATAS